MPGVSKGVPRAKGTWYLPLRQLLVLHLTGEVLDFLVLRPAEIRTLNLDYFAVTLAESPPTGSEDGALESRRGSK